MAYTVRLRPVYSRAITDRHATGTGACPTASIDASWKLDNPIPRGPSWKSGRAARSSVRSGAHAWPEVARIRTILVPVLANLLTRTADGTILR